MKRRDLLRHLQAHGCRPEREGGKHSLWINPETGAIEPIPRHVEIGKTFLARYAGNFRFPSREALDRVR